MSKIRRVIETMFRIYDKDGNLVDFKFNEIQAKIDEEIIEPIERYRILYGENQPLTEELKNALRNSILKYRQGGVTTLILAWFLVECMHKYTVAVMLTHDKDHSEKLLQRAKLMLKHLKGPEPKTSKLNENEIGFAKTDSVFYIGTAGSKEFGRSATITNLHCSEIAFWKDPSGLTKSLYQAVPVETGLIIHETTGNGWGNWFQKVYYNFLSGKGGFRPHFFPWFLHSKYISKNTFLPNAVSLAERREEWQLYRTIKRFFLARGEVLSKNQLQQKLQWRREKIDELEGDSGRDAAIKSFKVEYPSTYKEAFTFTGGSLFAFAEHTPDKNWVTDGYSAHKNILHPIPGYSYSVGGDAAGGTGHDNSTIIVTCLETREQVYEFADCNTDPVEYAKKLAEIGERYNLAYLVPENNNHGLSVMAILKKIYPLNRIYRHAQTNTQTSKNIPSITYGWKTTAISKPYMVGIGQLFLKSGMRFYSPLLEDELKSFVENKDTGQLGAESGHDDRVIGFLLSCIGLLKLMRLDGKDITELDIPPKIADSVKEKKKPKQIPWRDENGRYLVNFSDCFKQKGKKKSVHTNG